MLIDSSIKRFPQLGNLELLQAACVDHQFPTHFHETFVIQLVQNGADRCDINNLVATAGEVFVHFPNAAHAGGSSNNSRLKYSAIYPTAEFAIETLELKSDTTWFPSSFVIGDRKIAQLTDLLIRSLKNECREHAAKKLFRQLFQEIFYKGDTARSNRSTSCLANKLEVARQHLEANCRREISNRELSEICDLSESHLIREFKKAFLITPRQYLISQRVGQVRRLLTEGVSIAGSANDMGFTDQSHLSRCFKRVTGFSPGQFLLGLSTTCDGGVI